MNGEQAIKNTVMMRWKQEIEDTLALQIDRDKYEIDFKELDDQLNQIIRNRFKDRAATLHNNYTNKNVRTSLTQMASCVLDKMCVLGGDACLFYRHAASLSMNAPIIAELRSRRDYAKKQRKQFEKDSPGFIHWDTVQKNVKIIINSLYGVMGYHGFHFYNVNLAKSITATGRCIISTASCGYENFISNNIKFISFSEMVHYINNIVRDFEEDYPKYLNLFAQVDMVKPDDVMEHLRQKSAFKYTNDQALHLAKIITGLHPDCLKMVYYKNNIEAFNSTPVMKRIVRELFDRVQVLTLGDRYAFENPEKTGTICTIDAYDKFRDMLDAYRVMVQYNYPTYDCVRRTRYTNKKAVLYIDTDSNFIGLDPFVRYIRDDVYGRVDGDPNNFVFKICSVYTMLLSDVVARNFVYFYKMRNIVEEYGKILAMKNEFYFTRMAFANVKKRYFGWMMLQEGQLIKDGRGALEIKGFDFIKAGTKATIRNKYSDFVTQILHSDHINIRGMIDEALEFKEQMRNEVLSGDTSYFKQTTVSIPEHYKHPYSIQGIKGILVWNAINPEETMDLPAPVDIVPITLSRGFTHKRVDTLISYGPRPSENPNFNSTADAMPELYKFAKDYPDRYENFYNDILKNPIDEVNQMEFSVIAKPRHYNGDLPAWFKSIIDTDKIVFDAVSLLTPVLQSTGIKSSKVGKTKTINHYNNIVEI